MTLLERIITAAESDDPVPSLLRMMKTLASRTGTYKLSKWANQELFGYLSNASVPPYRGPFEMQVYATFRDNYGRREPNVPIGAARFPDEMKEPLFQYSFREPIAEIEAYLNNATDTEFSWSADTVVDIDRLFAAGQIERVLKESWRMTAAAGHVPRSRLAGILDQVRTVAHGLALEVEQSVPTAGEPTASPETNEKAAILITNNFDFSNANLSSSNNAFNSSEFNQSITTPAKGDTGSLEKALKEAGVSDANISELMNAVAEDPDEPAGGIGNRVSAWLQDQASKVLPAVATVITQSVFAFYGLPVGS